MSELPSRPSLDLSRGQARIVRRLAREFKRGFLLTFPVNVGTAGEETTTHVVFSDPVDLLRLYDSLGNFMEPMLRQVELARRARN